MPHYHANGMGDFVGAIEPDDIHVYDICPACGDLKLPDSELCSRCTAKRRADEASEAQDAKTAPEREKWRAFYRDMVDNHGWTVEDIWRDCIRRREERGDPVKPRFWSPWSIGE